MGNTQENAFDVNAAMKTWMDSMNEFWSGMSKLWPPDPTAAFTTGNSDAGRAGRKAQEAMATVMKNLQAFTKSMSTPESISALLSGAGTMPEILAQIAGSSFSGFLEVQKKMVQQISKLKDVGEAYRFEDLEENPFRVWHEVYEKELRRYFYIPQVGLTRGYQEQWNEAADKYNIFQTHVAEFLRLLGLPFERSMTLLQEKIAEMADTGSLPEDTQVYYHMWIKVLEGHFMTMFQEPEYVQTLSNTISALADYAAARNSVLEEMAGTLPIAKRSELDELAREVHELKKRTRRLEKQTQ